MLPSGWYLLGGGAAIISHPIPIGFCARFRLEASLSRAPYRRATSLVPIGRRSGMVAARNLECSRRRGGGDCGNHETPCGLKAPPARIPLSECMRGTWPNRKPEEYADVDVDYIAEIPLQPARSITGFKHDAITPGIDGCFRELRMEVKGFLAGTPKPGWNFALETAQVTDRLNGGRKWRCRPAPWWRRRGWRSRNRRSCPCSARRARAGAQRCQGFEMRQRISSKGGMHIKPLMVSPNSRRHFSRNFSASAGATPAFCGSSPIFT